MYKFLLPIRFLLKRPISYFAILALALCVFVVLVVITVLSGLTAEFKINTHHSMGDAVVESESLVGFPYYEEFMDELRRQDYIEDTAKLIRNYALIQRVIEGGFAGFAGSGAKEILGIEAGQFSEVTHFGSWLFYNSDNPEYAFDPSYAPNEPGIVLAAGLIYTRDDFGNFIKPETISPLKIEVTCFPLNAKGAPAKAGAGSIISKTFYHSDSFKSGLAQLDYHRVYISFKEAQELCGMTLYPKRINSINIKFRNKANIDKAAQKVTALWNSFKESRKGEPYYDLLNDVKVKTWQKRNWMILQVMEGERIMMITVFSLIGLIVVFIIFVIFYMIISHKSKDIGILKSIGISNFNVMNIFLLFSAWIGILGSLIGSLGGWLFLANINDIEAWLYEKYGFQLWDRQMYAIEEIPFQIDFQVLSIILLAAVFTCILGAYVPARKAAELNPVDSLQVNQL